MPEEREKKNNLPTMVIIDRGESAAYIKDVDSQYQLDAKITSTDAEFLAKLPDLLELLSSRNENEIIKLREIPIEEAKTMIVSYLNDHPGSWTSDIAENLGIDYEIVIKALNILQKDGMVLPGDNIEG